MTTAIQAPARNRAILRKIPGNIFAVFLLLFVFRLASEEFLNVSNLLNIV